MIVDMRETSYLCSYEKRKGKGYMDRKHGKVMTSYEETIMDLMIRIEESERYLKRHDTPKIKPIQIEEGERETYPSFAVERGKEEKAHEQEIQRQEVESDMGSFTDINDICAQDCYTKLTAWEWLEARKSAIYNLILVFSIFFLQLYTIWKEMNDISKWILQGFKYVCIILLLVKTLRWILSGGLHTYLNEES